MTSELHQLAAESNGAIQVGLPVFKPLLVVLAGPIKHWWSVPDEDWDKGIAAEYFTWRSAVEVACVKAGFLVYLPHKAWRGAWHEDAQEINNTAIRTADVLVNLSPKTVKIPAEGTALEVRVALASGTAVVDAPPGTMGDLDKLINTLYDYKEYAPGLTNLIDNDR